MVGAGKAGITAQLGGRSATSPKAFNWVGRTLADAVLNVLRHYAMLPGRARHKSPRYTGVQHALLAPVSGTFVAEAGLEFQQPLKQGDKLATIYGVYGDPLAELRAPVNGMVFGRGRCQTSSPATGTASTRKFRARSPNNPDGARSVSEQTYTHPLADATG